MRKVTLLLVGVVCGCGGGSAPAPAPPPAPTVSVEAADLWLTYTNAAHADAKYKGRVVEVRGRVMVVRPAEGGYVVGMDRCYPDGRDAMPGQIPERFVVSGCPPDVLCHVDAADAAGAARLVPGERAVLVGVCRGRVDTPESCWGWVVTFDKCRAAP